MLLKPFIYVSLFIVLASSYPQILSAQSIPSSVLDEQRQRQLEILRKEDLRNEIELENFRKQTPPSQQIIMDEQDSKPGDNGQCFDIHTILIEGNSALSSKHMDRAIATFSGKCLTISDIDEVLRVITNLYIDNGYTTSRAFVGQQDISKGTLIITILEGRIEQLNIEENGVLRDLKGNIFSSQAGDIFNIRDIEQGIDQINRLSSKEATIDVKPGKTQGTSKVNVKVSANKPWRYSTRIDNSGSQSTGKTQIQYQLEYDDFLGLYDMGQITYRHDINAIKGQNSESLSATYSIPITNWVARFSGSYFSYLTTISSDAQDFRSTGISRNFSGELEYLLHRNQDSKTKFLAILSTEESLNYLDSVLLETSSQLISTLEARLTHTKRLVNNNSVSFDIANIRGLKLFGAIEDDEADPQAPKAQFSKWQANANYQHKLNDHWLWQSTASMQYSPDILYSSQRIQIGGSSSVRGFDSESLSGDIGGYWQNNLIYTLPMASPKSFHDLFGKFSVNMGFDIGKIKADTMEEFERGIMKGMGIGLSSNGGYINISMDYEQPLSAPAFINEETHIFRLAASFHF